MSFELKDIKSPLGFEWRNYKGFQSPKKTTGGHCPDLESMAMLSSEQLAKSKETAEALSASIATATADAERLATQAGPQLVESLLSVRETAAQATCARMM